MIAGILVGALAIARWREHLRDDLPRLVLVKREDFSSKKPVVFRLEAPKHRRVQLATMSTVVPATGKERRPLDVSTGDTLCSVTEVPTPQGTLFWVGGAIEAEAGQSREFRVLPPPDDVWQLRCQVALGSTGVQAVLRRLELAWMTKSLWPLRGKFSDAWGVILSPPITNSAPPSAEMPVP